MHLDEKYHRKTLNRPKRNECSLYKSAAANFSSSLLICPSIFFQETPRTSVHRKMQHELPDAHHEQKYNPVAVRGGDKSPKSSIHVGHNKRKRSDLKRAGKASEQFNETCDVRHEREAFDTVSECWVRLADYECYTTDYIPNSWTHNTGRTRRGSDSQRSGTATEQSAAKGTMWKQTHVSTQETLSPEIFVQSMTEGTMCTHTFESTQGKIQNLWKGSHKGRNKSVVPGNWDCNTNCQDEESGRELSPRLDPHTQQFGALNGVGNGNLEARYNKLASVGSPLETLVP
jgi:hypothetical protein